MNICCATWSLPAEDAEYMSSLKAVLVLYPTVDGNNSLTLYSGATKLAKVHVPSRGPASGGWIISLSMQRLSLDPLSESGIGRRLIPSTPLNSSRRSSPILPSADFRDTSVILSPIPASNSPQPCFRALQDPVGYHVTIKCSKRTLLRTSLLPPLASSVLIERCLCALRVAIPPDAYLDDLQCLIESAYARSVTQLGILNLPHSNESVAAKQREPSRLTVNRDATYLSHLPSSRFASTLRGSKVGRSPAPRGIVSIYLFFYFHHFIVVIMHLLLFL